MPFIVRLRLFLLLILPATTGLQAQPAVSFSHLDRIKGLSSDIVQAICQDHFGFMWIGTNDGLNLYDGNSITVFRHNRHDSTSICDDFIYSIVCDQDGFIWVGTANGVSKIDPVSRKASAVSSKASAAGAVDNLTECRLFTGRQNTIWLCNSVGLSKLDRNRNCFIRQPLLLDGQPDNERISCFSSDSINGTWLGTYNGLLKLDEKNGTVKRYSTDQALLVNAIYSKAKGELLFASWGQGFGLFREEESSFANYKWDKTPVNPSATNIANCIITDGCAMYFGSNFGLFGVPCNGSISEPIHILHADNENTSLITNDVRCLLRDRDENIWVGTARGISIIFKKHQHFQVIPGISGFVTRIIENRNGSRWMSSWYGRGLQLLDSNYREIKNFGQVPPADNDLNASQISDICLARNGMLWIATMHGLCSYDEKTGRFSQLMSGQSGLSSNRLNCLAEDSKGRIWIGNYLGIDIYDPASGQFSHYREAKSDTGITNSLVWTFQPDPKGNIWVLTNSGASRWNAATGKFENIHAIETEGRQIPLQVVSGVYDSPDGTLYISSSNGLFARGNDRTWTYYSTEEGLVNKDISGMVPDRAGNLWLSTKNGLSCFRTKEKRFVNFTSEKGLPFSFLQSYMGIRKDGAVYISDGARLAFFLPEKLAAATDAPELYLTRIQAGETVLFPMDSKPGKDEFDYDENDLAAEFTAPDFDGSGLQVYAYRIGDDSTWTSIGNRRTLRFANLAPGDYKLSIRVANSDGLWSRPVVYSFTILPPFWRTGWFISLFVLLALFVVIFVVRYISQRRLRERILLLEKEQAIEKERNRISKDMHDDLGSGLTKIAILSEVVKRRLDQPLEAGKQMDTISESARELVDNLNEIIWALNPGNDNLENLSAYLREYASRYFEAYDVRLVFNYPDPLPALKLSEEQRRNIFLVLKEVYHNIAKHAACSEIETSVSTRDGKISFTVHDNGKGFDAAGVGRFSNGLDNMNKRMQSVGGRFSISSEAGKGTTVVISI